MRARLLGRSAAAGDALVAAVLAMDPRRPPGTAVAGDARARVLRWTDPAPAMVKVYCKTAWVAWTHPPGIRSPGAREWDALLAMHTRGIPVVEPLCAVEWRLGPFARASAIATRPLADSMALVEFLGRRLPLEPPRHGDQLRRRLVVRLGRLVARCHAAGVLHGRLSLKNVLATPADCSTTPELVLLDPPQARIGAAADLRATTAALADLRSLDRRSWCFFTRTDRLRFVAAYLTALDSPSSRATRRQVITRYYRAIGSPAQARQYEERPGRRAHHAQRRRWLSPRLGHRIRARLATRFSHVAPPRYPQALTIDCRAHQAADDIGGQPAIVVLEDLVESLGPHLTAFRVLGPVNSATKQLWAAAEQGGIPSIGETWWDARRPLRGACRRPWEAAAIDTQGRVTPDGDPPPARVLGRLDESRFRDIWSGPGFARERDAHRAWSDRPGGDPCPVCTAATAST